MMFVPSDRSASLLESSLVVAIVSLTALTFVSALCVTGCKAKQRLHRSKGKNNGIKETSNGSCTKDADVEKNGDIHQNGRALGHDRALPEIPATASGVASTDDDDEEDEGHYDVISKSRRLASLQSTLPATASAHNKKLIEANQQPKRGNHPYEKVRGDPDSESATYAGIPDTFSVRRRADIGISIVNQSFESGHTNLVDPPSDPLYAGVGEEDGTSVEISPGTSSKPTQPPVYSVVGTRTSERTRSKLIRDNMTDASAASSVTPPVPDRCYEARDFIDGVEDSSISASNGCDTGSWAACGTASSRSVMGSSPTAVSSFWGTVGPSHSASGESTVVTDEAGPTSVGGAAMPESNDETLPVAATAETAETVKRVPNYSSLTARESLENLRRRQQLQQPLQSTRQRMADIGAADFIEVDGTYDTINYDLIRPHNNVDSTSGAMPVMFDNAVYNNGSDLYAEISTAPSSTHSSTYARVGDLIGTSEQAPMPPSVDALQQLTHYVVANDDCFADPGYSRVDRPRPRSAHVTTASHPVSVPVTSSARGRRSPVYAVISRPSRSSRGTESAVSAAEGRPDLPSGTSASNLYSQVARRGQHRRAMSSEVSLIESGLAVDSRTAELSRFARFSAASHSDVDFLQNYSGYASIDVEPANTGCRLAIPNSDYNTVGEMEGTHSAADGVSLFNDFDPNYERVGVPSIRATHNDASVRSFGVAREFVPASDPDDRFVGSSLRSNFLDSTYRPMRTSPPLIREHIYQEVTLNSNSSNVPLAGVSASGRVQPSTRSGGRSGMLSTDL